MKKKSGWIWNFLKETKYHFIAILILFFAFAVIGFAFPVFFADFIKNFIEETIRKTEGMNFFQLFIFILQNNLVTSLMGMIFGAFLGIFPVLIGLFNGYVLGFVSGKAAAANGNIVLLRLLPHGLFEIPALVISLGLGLRLGLFPFTNKITANRFLALLEKCLKVFLYIVIPLLVVAAIIETGLIAILK